MLLGDLPAAGSYGSSGLVVYLWPRGLVQWVVASGSMRTVQPVW
jgi:hypothetical protein